MLNNNRELPSFSFIFYCICFEMDAEGESEVVQLRARVASLEREVSGLQKSMSELQSQFMRLVPLLAQVPMPPKIEEDENDSSHQDNSALESDDFNQKMDLAGQPKGITRLSPPPCVISSLGQGWVPWIFLSRLPAPFPPLKLKSQNR